MSYPRARLAPLLPAFVLGGACAGGQGAVTTDTGVHGAAPPALTASARSSSDAPRAGRTKIGAESSVALAPVVLPTSGARSALLVHQTAGGSSAFARVVGATGEQGPTYELGRAHVYGALDFGDDETTIVTSEDDRVCVTTFAAGSKTAEGHGCAAIAPAVAVPLGDRVAFLELAVARPGQPPREPPSTAQNVPVPKRQRPRDAPSKPSGSKSKPTKKGHHPPKPTVDVFVRFASRSGEFDEEAKPTGIHFQEPLDGMTLIDAAPRGKGADLLWYEWAPKRPSSTNLGSARLVAATIDASGALEKSSRVAVLDADLEFGWLKDHQAPRLVVAGDQTLFVDEGKDRKCEIEKLFPAKGQITVAPATCAIMPQRFAEKGAIDAAEIAGFEKILAEEPRRAIGQPSHEPGLVAWAGDRAYYLSHERLRSATKDGASREEPAPFPAKRSRISLGAIAPSGEGVAIVDGAVVRVDAKGDVESAGLPADSSVGGLLGARDPIDKRRAARVGDAVWIARGDLVRVAPDVQAPPALRGAAPFDASALVGGAREGLLVGVESEELVVRALSPMGELTERARSRAPIRAGFDACERAKGGAIVAGVSSADASSVVAFAIDEDGRRASEPRAIAIPVRAGETEVRVVPLPNGGALATDLDRKNVVWLDDDGAPLASAPWPVEESDASCVDGRPARAAMPSPRPSVFVRVPELARAGTCVVGDPIWAKDGTLRWFGAEQSGLDSIAELGVARVELPAEGALADASLADASTPVSDASAALVDASDPVDGAAPPDDAGSDAGAPVAIAARAPCPGDMVSVAGKFCIDRFEDALVDAATGAPFSPDYPITPTYLDIALGEWATGRERVGDLHARAFPLPDFPPWQRVEKAAPLAVSRFGARPSGYASGFVAEEACEKAGKRLCMLEEFVTACRGENDTDYPYGDSFQDGACNVFREDHPAAILHGNVSVGHLDPRLNWAKEQNRPLYQTTGASPACRSRWGSDAAYDLVGNLDEWIDRGPKLGNGFAGGFYSRATRAGCDALVVTHPKSYFDYSTGVRCCKDAAK